jgi:Predicted enzyme related to lactoylglutathione lyase
MPTLVHFEIPSDDLERSKKFYSELFGWNFEKWSGPESLPEGMEYLIITTTDDKGNKSIGGGMMKRQNSQQQGMTNYIDVKSVDEHSDRVMQLGGKVVIPKNLLLEWVILLCALILRITLLVFGKPTLRQSN